VQKTGMARDDRKGSEQARPRASFLSLRELRSRKDKIYSANAGHDASTKNSRLRQPKLAA